MSGTVSSRQIAERVLVFGFDERLHNNNLLLYDEATRSLWSQLGGQAIQGSLAGTQLTSLPTMQTSWQHWRALYPRTDVISYPTGAISPFRYPVAVGRQLSAEFASPPPSPDQLVLGMAIAGEAKAYPFVELARLSAPLHDQLGGSPIVIHYASAVPAAWAEGAAGKLLASVTVLGTGWRSFHPQSQRFRAPRTE